MTGTLFNVAAILVGGLLGLSGRFKPSASLQNLLKAVLGFLVAFVGMATAWRSVHGPFTAILQQLTVVMISLVLGNVVGKALGLQRHFSRLGSYAQKRFAQCTAQSPSRFSDGFLTCALVFCITPIGILGSLLEGLDGNNRVLAVKAGMDGVAMTVFAAVFGWGALFCVVPVLAFQGTLTLLARASAPLLTQYGLLDPLNTTAGLLVVTLALMVFEIRRVPLADYLPSLLFAPLLAGLWRALTTG